jgi:hypothetical protein
MVWDGCYRRILLDARLLWRRSLNRTYNGRSGSAAGTGLHAQSGHCARSAQSDERTFLFAAMLRSLHQLIRTKRLSEHHYRIGMPPLSTAPPPVSRTV